MPNRIIVAIERLLGYLENFIFSINNSNLFNKRSIPDSVRHLSNYPTAYKELINLNIVQYLYKIPILEIFTESNQN